MTQAKSDERERRAARLAAALKENLMRRKAQARGRAAEDVAKPVQQPRKPTEDADEG